MRKQRVLVTVLSAAAILSAGQAFTSMAVSYTHLEAAFYSYEERGIGRLAARELYGQILRGSVTRLERYAACAYAHFLGFGLELKERRAVSYTHLDVYKRQIIR